MAALLVAGLAFLLHRDRAGGKNALESRLDELLHGPSSTPPSTPSPSTSPTPTSPAAPNPLGGALGAGGVDPACLLGDGGAGDLLSGLAGGGVRGTVAQQVTQIAELVEEERGLRFDHSPTPELLPADQFDQRVAAMVAKDYTDAEADLDGRLLQLLGAIPTGTDLKALEQDLLSGQVAGFYDPESGDIVVRVPDSGASLDANGQITLAHELDHALTDQALGLPNTDVDGQSDADLAQLGLIEGDATLLMERFGLRNVGLLDQLRSATGPEVAAAQRDLDRAPVYLQNQLLFPYTAGLAYTCRLQQNGGWKGVDAAYRDLPRTTAEVLFADRAGLAPADARDPGTPSGWQAARHDTFGAAPLQWLFEAPGGEARRGLADASDAAHHWAGGETSLFTRGARSALALDLVDTDDSQALCGAVERWYTAAFDSTATKKAGVTVLTGADQVGALRCAGRDVRLGIAPDQATGIALAA